MADISTSFPLLYSYNGPRPFRCGRPCFLSSDRRKPFVCAELGPGRLRRPNQTTWYDDDDVPPGVCETVFGPRRWIRWESFLAGSYPGTGTQPERIPLEHWNR